MSAQEPESSPYRILYVSAAGQVGGAEKSLLDLLDGLDRSRFEPAVAFPAGGDLAEELARREIPLSLVSLSRFRRTWNPFQLAGYAFRWCRGASDVRQVIDFRKPDVVHANGDMAQVYVGKAGRARPAARVWHVRDTASPVWLRRRLAARADRIIAVSHSVEKALVSQGIPAEKIRVVLNGIDTKPFESVPPPPEGPATVGMV
ncbi:MAG: glycosyltransferase, partial [Armatimonadetes bacterium]|nr:glycosyltransferase [Armatimonadota bacterium]